METTNYMIFLFMTDPIGCVCLGFIIRTNSLDIVSAFLQDCGFIIKMGSTLDAGENIQASDLTIFFLQKYEK